MARDQQTESLKLCNEEALIAKCFAMTLSFKKEGNAMMNLPCNPFVGQMIKKGKNLGVVEVH